MFEQPNPMANKQPSNKPAPKDPEPKKTVEDIFDSVDGSEAAPKPKPKADFTATPPTLKAKEPQTGSTPGSKVNIPPGGISANASEGPSPFAGKSKAPGMIGNKKFFIIGLVALVIIVLAVGGWFAYTKFFSGPQLTGIELEETTQPTTQVEEPVDSGVQPEPEEETSIVIEPPTTPVDTDGDGLSDEVEKERGTDHTSVDTDDDGLFDFEEVMTYETDPLNADTDGDGYLDGEEVDGGYDPNGPGKLLNIE